MDLVETFYYGVNPKKPVSSETGPTRKSRNLGLILYFDPNRLSLGNRIFKAFLLGHGLLQSVSDLNCFGKCAYRSLMSGEIVLPILAHVYLVPHGFRILQFRLVCTSMGLGPSQFLNRLTSPTTLLLRYTNIHTPQCLHQRIQKLTCVF